MSDPENAPRADRSAHYRDRLRRELENRLARNPLYSIRAMARDLTISPSQLTAVLNGNRGLSMASAVLVIENLRMNEFDARDFLVSVAVDQVKDPAQREKIHRQLLGKRFEA